MTPKRDRPMLAWIVLAALLVPLLASSAGCSDPTGPPGPRRTVLLTGFQPFGGRDVNESWEAVKVLDGEVIRGRRVVTACLPVVYDEMAAPLAAALERARPEVVVSFGVGTEVVRVETTARNGYHPQRPLDNAGKPPPRDRLEPGGPDTVPTSLPTEAILAALARANVPARASDDAGGYLCNECCWRLARADGPALVGVRRRGFVHVPPAGAPNPAGGTFDLATIRRAVRTVAEATLEALDRDAAGPR